MQISFLGNACFKLIIGQASALLDPFDNSTGLKPPRAQADLVIVSQKDGRNPDAGGSDAFVVDQPGEYEVKGIAVDAIPSLQGNSILTVITAEDMHLGHLGDANHALTNGELEHLEGVDVLFVPVGGKGVFDPKKAAEVVTSVEPRLVIPYHFKVTGLKTARESVDIFLKAMGAKNPEALDKFRLIKKELPADETKVVVLNVA